jgi:MFS family permease
MRSILRFAPFSSLGVFRFGIYFSFANACNWMIMLGAPMVLLAEHLGATPFQVGLLYSSAFLMLPVQVGATAFLPYLGFRRQLLIGWGARSVFILVPIVISILGPEAGSGGLLTLYILTVFTFCFFRSFGAAALLPWLYAILPENTRGRYFGTDSMATGSAGILILILSGSLFGFFSAYTAFALLFSITLFAAICSLFFVSRLPDGDRPVVIPLTRLLRRAPRLCLEPGKFRHYLGLQVLYAAVGFAFVPFSVFYLRAELGLSQSFILFLTALQFLGMTSVSFVLREWVDRIGAKPFFLISHLATISFQFCWIILVAFPHRFEAGLPLVYLIVGVAMACFMTANFKYLPQICEGRERALAVSVFSAVVGFLGGIAATLWGFLLKDAATGGIDRFWFLAYFTTAMLVQCYLFYAYTKLRELRRDVDSLPARGWLVRPFRYLVTLIDLVDRDGSNRPSTK